LNSDVDRCPADKILTASTKTLAYNDSGSSYSLSEIAKNSAPTIETQKVKILKSQTRVMFPRN
jgi:hypothetical protein